METKVLGTAAKLRMIKKEDKPFLNSPHKSGEMKTRHSKVQFPLTFTFTCACTNYKMQLYGDFILNNGPLKINVQERPYTPPHYIHTQRGMLAASFQTTPQCPWEVMTTD